MARPIPIERGSVVRYDPWIEHLAWLMDSSIGIGPWSIGIDGVIGLVPGLGDVAGAVVSMLIVARAVRAGVPRIAIARMVANVAIDVLVGSVPLAGDLFDFAFKANVKNARIYRESLGDTPAGTMRHWAFFGVLLLCVAALLAIPVFLAVILLHALHS